MLRINWNGLSMRRVWRLYRNMQSKLDTFFAPPVAVRGMRQLDRAAFRREVTLPAVFLQEASLCSKFLKKLHHVVLKYPRIKKIHTHIGEPGEDKKEERVLLLTPDTCLQTPVSEDDLVWIKENGGRSGVHTLTVEYEHYSGHAVLRAVLSEYANEIPTGFEIVGHIAHLNLRKDFLPYKTLIGEVVLDQQSSVRTVVNKTDSIDNTFRFFKMELLAGEDNMNATVRENGCTFTFDFSKVYWNSRLHTEHERVIGLIKPGDVVVDVFAGVGPFAVPAAKKDCTVYANDLNPHSYASLVENAKINRVSSQLHAFNMDGRDFLRKVIPKLVDDIVLKPITQLPSESVVICNHIVMNLPATAVLFLNVLKGLFLSVPHNIRDRVSLPTVHCYCFAKSEQPDKESREMVEKNLGACLSPEDVCSVFNVRHVAPNKVMMRVTFRLPKEVAFNDIGNSAQDEQCDSEPRPKRSKTS